MQNLETLDNQYTIVSKLDRDSSRVYYLAKHNQSQNYYLIELLKDNNINAFPANEINVLNILQNINNPNIIHYIENGNGPLILKNKPPINKPYLKFEYASKYNLFKYISTRRFTERQGKLIFRKILNGVRAIHDAGICHRNINSFNILLDENFNPKISGYSSACINANNLQEFLNTSEYTAPEIFLHLPYNGIQYDIFSLGQLLFYIVTRQLGFKSSQNNDPFYSLIRQHNYGVYWNSDPFLQLNLSQSFKNLFVRMVDFNPNQRPTINQILNDEWMQEINNLNAEQLNALEIEVKNEFQMRENQLHEFPPVKIDDHSDDDELR